MSYVVPMRLSKYPMGRVGSIRAYWLRCTSGQIGVENSGISVAGVRPTFANDAKLEGKGGDCDRMLVSLVAASMTHSS